MAKKEVKEVPEVPGTVEVVEELISLTALRTCVTITRGEVLGKFEISKEDLEKDSKIQRFIEIGFIVEA